MKVSEAITAKITEKIYLAVPRPTSVIAQGIRQAAPALVSLGQLIRDRM